MQNEIYKHVAKVVEKTIPVEKEAAVALGSNAQFNDGGEKKIGTCLFTLISRQKMENIRFLQQQNPDRSISWTEICSYGSDTAYRDRNGDYSC